MQRSNTEQEEGGLYLTDQFVPWSQLSEVLKKSQIPLFSESSIAFAVTSWFLIIAIALPPHMNRSICSVVSIEQGFEKTQFSR